MTNSANPHYERRWAILALIGAAQLMVILDLTIVNIALPSAQQDLGFTDDLRQWIITAYALTFGSLLLFGGRLGDLFGRKWMFISGLLGFAVASAIGGAASSFGVLVAARALQGVFGAMLAPSALALLATTFTDPVERGKAFGVFGAIAGAGSALGLLLGGALTEWLSWRWCLYVNLFFALPVAFGAWRLLHVQRHPDRPPLDVLGTIVATTGLFCAVFGFSYSETHSWTTPITLILLVTSLVLITAFIVIESREKNPLLPLGILVHRTRGGAYLALALTYIAMFAVFLFFTYFLQRTKGYTPIETGLAYLPMTLAIVSTAMTVNIKLLGIVGPRKLLTGGMLLGGLAMLWFTQIEPNSSYVGHLLPNVMLLGCGFGAVISAGINTATYGVAPRDAGVASAMVNTLQQVGGSVGTAMLSSIFASAVSSYAGSHAASPTLAVDASMHGNAVVFYVATGIFLVGALVVGTTMRDVRIVPDHGGGTAEPAAAA